MGNRNEKRKLQHDHTDNGNDAHDADMAVFHDFQNPLPGSGAEKPIRRIGETVHMQTTRNGYQKNDDCDARRKGGKKVIRRVSEDCRHHPDEEPDGGEKDNAPFQFFLTHHQSLRERDNGEKLDGGEKGFHESARETAASSNVATSVRTRTAASTRCMERAAPVPSPSRKSRSRRGFFPRALRPIR